MSTAGEGAGEPRRAIPRVAVRVLNALVVVGLVYDSIVDAVLPIFARAWEAICDCCDWHRVGRRALDCVVATVSAAFRVWTRVYDVAELAVYMGARLSWRALNGLGDADAAFTRMCCARLRARWQRQD